MAIDRRWVFEDPPYDSSLPLKVRSYAMGHPRKRLFFVRPYRGGNLFLMAYHGFRYVRFQRTALHPWLRSCAPSGVTDPWG